MASNKGAGIKPTVSILAVTGADERGYELAHFEMQMGEIPPIGSANGRDLLAAPDCFVRCNQDRLHMTIE